MSYELTPEDVCTQIQATLGAISQVNPSEQLSQFGTIRALESSRQTAGVGNTSFVAPLDLDNGDGSLRPFAQIKYFQRGTQDNGRNTRACSSTVAPKRQVQSFAISQYWEVVLEFDWADIRLMCGDQNKGVPPMFMPLPDGRYSLVNDQALNEFMRGGFLAQLNGFWAGVNEISINRLALGTGVLKSDNATVDPFSPDAVLPVLHTAENSVNGKGFNEMFHQLASSELLAWGVPYVVGFGNLDRLMSALTYSYYNTNIGMDYPKLMNSGRFIGVTDYQVGDLLGDANNVLSFLPGTAYPVTFLRNRGYYQGTFGNMYHGLGQDSRLPGYVFDVDVWFNNCGNGFNGDKVLVRISSTFDIWTMPLDIFKSNDRLAGVNGIFAGWNLQAA